MTSVSTLLNSNTTKGDVGLSNVEDKSSQDIRDEITASDIPNLDATKITGGELSTDRLPTIPVNKGGTGLTSISTLLNTNTTKADVGLSNVDNKSSSTIISEISKSDIDALNVDAATVNDKTVETSVPSNAVFTDTNTQIDKAGVEALGIQTVGALTSGSISTGFSTIPVAQGGTGLTSISTFCLLYTSPSPRDRG